MSLEKILVIDDEEIIRQFITETLTRRNYHVTTTDSGRKGVALAKDTTFDLIFTDMKMPDLTGIEVLKKIKEISPSTIVVVITGYGSIENAVEAMRLGAFNYLIKPFSPDTIEAVIEKAKEHHKLVVENQYLREEVSRHGTDNTYHVIAESASMKSILKDVTRIAKSNSSVFISGESGTGKEVIAQALHSQSLRASRPFIKVNCAAIPETLIESEFFGHEKGSFTGATGKRIGRFELAHGGTLLLDEVTEIPQTVQAKLLRAVQEHVFERVGGNIPIKVDVRLISTSNRDIKQAIAERILREDLYYRLNVVPIYLPPLRERVEDVIPLANYFIERTALENHKDPKELSAAAKRKLLGYSWPGNVRELANIIERAVVMTPSRRIEPSHLFIEIQENSSQRNPLQTHLLRDTDGLGQNLVGLSLEELEKKLIIETLQAQNNNQKKTAEILGISPRTLRNKLHDYRSNPDV